MNKRKQGIEVNLSVIAISAILVTALFVMSSSGFMPNAMAQGLTNQTGAAGGGLANQTGAAGGGLANQTGGLANQTGGLAGGLANQTGGLTIPEGTLTEIVSNLDVLEGVVADDEEAMTAADAIRGALEERAMLAGMTLPEPAAEGEDAAADEGEDAAAADEGEDAAAADEGEDAAGGDEGEDAE
jgi:hypothetical protein